jgi:hypothetical protein
VQLTDDFELVSPDIASVDTDALDKLMKEYEEASKVSARERSGSGQARLHCPSIADRGSNALSLASLCRGLIMTWRLEKRTKTLHTTSPICIDEKTTLQCKHQDRGGMHRDHLIHRIFALPLNPKIPKPKTNDTFEDTD